MHSVDSLVAREVIRRSKYDKYQLDYVMYLHQTLSDEMRAQAIEPISVEKRMDLGTLGELIHLYEESGILTVRIMEYIKNVGDYLCLSEKHRNHLYEVMSKMIQYKPFDIAVIHDSFSCTANNMNFVRYWYNDVLANIVDSDLLQFLLNQVCLQPPELYSNKTTRKILAEKVRNSSYGLT